MNKTDNSAIVLTNTDLNLEDYEFMRNASPSNRIIIPEGRKIVRPDEFTEKEKEIVRLYL